MSEETSNENEIAEKVACNDTPAGESQEIEASSAMSEKQEPTAEELLAAANDRYLRARADFENYRKRMAREFGEVRESSKQQTIGEFLRVYDMFMLAVGHTEHSADLETLKQGMKMILDEFQRTFENLGVKRMVTVGQDFDPNVHEAASQEPSDTVPEGKIIREWRPGFMIHDKLLRTASVVVSAGKQTTEE